MKKLTIKILSYILILSITSSISVPVSAACLQKTDAKEEVKKDNVIVTNKGVFINGYYFSQRQFMKLLDNSIEINKLQELEGDTAVSGKITIQSATAVVAGTWWIPGIGEIVITAAGVIIIGGAVIKAGSWLYNKVVDWFEAKAKEKAEKEEYEDAKKKGEKTKKHTGTKSHEQKRKGEPYSSNDNYDEKGRLKERRYFGKDGKPDMDIHYTDHGNPKEHPKVPHRHNWKNGKPGDSY